jgi:hypothetical protein
VKEYRLYCEISRYAIEILHHRAPLCQYRDTPRVLRKILIFVRLVRPSSPEFVVEEKFSYCPFTIELIFVLVFLFHSSSEFRSSRSKNQP